MKRIGEASAAVAEAVKLCKPQVISIYPITPQTHIVERLSELVNNGELKAEVIRAESEHSMVSAIIGASLTGSRVFSATSSQGLALAHEVMHIVSGMRIPAVMAIAARALSAPINIWGDHSDVMTSRDTSWIQLHCKNTQAAFDTIIQAYYIAEKIKLPVMVILDGFTLTHLAEPVDVAEQKKVDLFLPPLKMNYTLNPEKPISFGNVAFPTDYMEIKHKQAEAMVNAEKIIKEANNKFYKIFKRKYGDGLIEIHNPKASKVIIASGTTAETCKTLKDFCVIHLRCFRPFPYESIRKALEGKKEVYVIDRSYSYGAGGPLWLEVCNIFKEAKSRIMGLGGRDITLDSIRKAVSSKEKEMWVDKL